MMPAEKGSSFLLKISNGATPPVFTALAGLRVTTFSLNAEAVAITNKSSQGWRELLSGAGVRTLSLGGSGVFFNSAGEIRVRDKALLGELDDYEVSFESSDRFRGKFLITRLEYAGDFNGERTYTLSLESAGPISVLA
jgi:TP901-1 family phage major tail protein